MSVPTLNGADSPATGDVTWGVREEETVLRPVEDDYADSLAEVRKTQNKRVAPRGVLPAVLWVVTVTLLVCHAVFVLRLLVGLSNGNAPNPQQSSKELLPAELGPGAQPVANTAAGMPEVLPQVDKLKQSVVEAASSLER
ncbi:hypothetical protein Emed_000970 [Eimeria media]